MDTPEQSRAPMPPDVAASVPFSQGEQYMLVTVPTAPDGWARMLWERARDRIEAAGKKAMRDAWLDSVVEFNGRLAKSERDAIEWLAAEDGDRIAEYKERLRTHGIDLLQGGGTDIEPGKIVQFRGRMEKP